MIILREFQINTSKEREQLEEELSKKLGEKVVILPACLEVVKGLNGDLKSTVVDLVDCNLSIAKVLRSCMENELSRGARDELENQLLILNDLKKYVVEKDW